MIGYGRTKINDEPGGDADHEQDRQHSKKFLALDIFQAGLDQLVDFPENIGDLFEEGHSVAIMGSLTIGSPSVGCGNFNPEKSELKVKVIGGGESKRAVTR